MRGSREGARRDKKMRRYKVGLVVRKGVLSVKKEGRERGHKFGFLTLTFIIKLTN